MVPTPTGKPGKWESIFQSGNFEQTGKVRDFYTEYCKSRGILDNFFSDLNCVQFLLKVNFQYSDARRRKGLLMAPMSHTWLCLLSVRQRS